MAERSDSFIPTDAIDAIKTLPYRAAEHRMGPPRWEPGLAQDEWANRCLVDSELWPCAAISQQDTDRAAR